MPSYESSYPPNLYHASRYRSSHKESGIFASLGSLSISRIRLLAVRLFTLTNVLCVIWGYTLHWGERRVIRNAIRSCDWERWERWPEGATPERVVLVADPQLVDGHTYPGRNSLLLSLTEFYVDMYMHRAWEATEDILASEATIFLGDLFDGGREWDHDTWLDEYYRFQKIFPARAGKLTLTDVAGNHDIGFGDTVVIEALNWFKAYFGEPNRQIDIGNHTFVILDTISMMNTNDSTVHNPPNHFFDKVSGDIANLSYPSLPRILLTHVPLFRAADARCGPKREGNPSLPIAQGYQFQTVISAELSSEILNKIQPIAIFSGDDHDACKHIHTISEGARASVEYTVKTFSIAMGVSYPGIELISLWNPSKGEPIEQGTIQTKLCLLPSQFDIFRTYFKTLMFTVIAITYSTWSSWKSPSKTWKPGLDFLSGGGPETPPKLRSMYKDKSYRTNISTAFSPSVILYKIHRSRWVSKICGRPDTFRRLFLGKIAKVGAVAISIYLILIIRQI
ncbi:Metallo-dependent phosphatase-like protein [Lipomyces oligophaga]|uniref:Metallo-dependent phosphatase-like protein n=1 Tax=Lipomyces oligophaga TaxID=45792 RepID=UPI0034CF82BF